MPVDYGAGPQAPNYGAYGVTPYPTGPTFMDQFQGAAGMLANAISQYHAKKRADQALQISKEQHAQQLDINRADEARKQAAEARAEAQTQALYTGRNETIPGEVQTVQAPAMLTKSPMDRTVAAGLQTPPIQPASFGSLGLGSSYLAPPPSLPASQSVEEQRKMPDTIVHHPGLYEQKFEGQQAIQQQNANTNAGFRSAMIDQGQQKLGIAQQRANAYIAKSRADAARAPRGAPGQITPAIMAAKTAQIIEEAMTNPPQLGGLAADELDALTQAASEPAARVQAVIANPQTPPRLRAYLTRILPYRP